MPKETLSEIIMRAKSPWDNPYQGSDKKVLFVCSAGILRSATAARIYAHKYNTRCAGSAHYALIPVTEDLLLWTDEVVFVNVHNYRQVADNFDLEAFPCKRKLLHIEDDYPHMDPRLIQLFKDQYEDF